MNSNRILNLPAPGDVKEPARLQDILDASGSLNSTNASLVTATATTNNAGVTVQAQLNNLGESTGAANVGNTPAGNISATTVQAAINELDTEKQPLDATLTALAGTLTAANKIPYATALDTAGELDFKDEDDMASNSATAVPSQQSVRAYVDSSSYSGTYTPTATAGTNTSGVSPAITTYIKVGTAVTVTGHVSLSVTAGSTDSNFYLSLPIASNLAVGTQDLIGVPSFNVIGLTTFVSGRCLADTTNDRAMITFVSPAGGTGTYSCYYTYTYQVI